MLQDIFVIENIFEDPDKIVNFAKKQQFYIRENHPTEKDSIARWEGTRSMPIRILDNDFFLQVTNHIINKTLNYEFQARGVNLMKWRFSGDSYFHLALDGITGTTHSDHTLYAGVIYLNPNPKKDYGTIFYNEDGEIIKTVTNEFNKLIFYNGSIPHQPVGGFGNSLDNGRLTLNLFFQAIEFYKDIENTIPQ